jgi:hypothetical protein
MAAAPLLERLAGHQAARAPFERMRAFSAPIGEAMSGAEALAMAVSEAPIAIEGLSDLDDIPPGPWLTSARPTMA